jgi:hypothetical protein
MYMFVAMPSFDPEVMCEKIGIQKLFIFYMYLSHLW